MIKISVDAILQNHNHLRNQRSGFSIEAYKMQPGIFFILIIKMQLLNPDSNRFDACPHTAAVCRNNIFQENIFCV